jgi:GT2 family glycosyltransferase/ubiquinone/menaquinone biosynthesis C-methylase UbiE
MEFTGERFAPLMQGEINFEHLHRYALSAEFAAGKSVLDLSSGECSGGAALLSRVARTVTVVELGPASIARARRGYHSPNLNFLSGSYDHLPLPDASVGLVTAFEAAEGHVLSEETLREVKRVLGPEGVLVVSSPNRPARAGSRSYPGPFRVGDCYEEFYQLLGRHFTHLRVYGQRLAAGSFIFPLQGASGDALRAYSGDPDNLKCSAPSPAHFVAVCSDAPLDELRALGSLYADDADDLLERAEGEKLELFERMRRAEDAASEREQSYEARVDRMGEELSRARARYEEQIDRLAGERAHALSEGETLSARRAEEQARLEAELANARARLSELERQLADSQAQLERQAAANSETQSQLVQRNTALVEVHSQLLRKDEVINWIHTSRSWQVLNSVRNLYHRLGVAANNLLRRLRLPARTTFRGAIESPAEDASCSKFVEVTGWVASAAGRVTLVEAFLDGFFLGAVRHSSERPDIAASFPSKAWKVFGYSERLPLYNSLAGRRTLTIRAFDQNGNSHLFARPLKVAYYHESAQDTVAPLNAGAAARPDARAAESRAHVEVSKRGEAVKGDFLTQFEEIVTRFEGKMNRAPFILNWNTGLRLSEAFPQLAIISPCGLNGNGRLPYLDHTVDIVLLPSRDGEELAEARRVAGTAVVQVEGLRPRKKEGKTGRLSATRERSRLRLRAEWRDEELLEAPAPETSVIIPVFNKVEYTRNCLAQLQDTLPPNFRGEVIVVDDASTDETPSVVEEFARRDARIKLLRNEENLGFIRSCNRAAEAASGEVLVFLNNDTLPQPGWLPPLLKVLQDYADAGAVGGKLIYPDGTLQEAGGVIFSDASGCNFGKHDQANAPLYNFMREVDYCSGALLATRRELFNKLGGFDTRFAPAYYEDTDYCFGLRERGYRVYYQPESVVIHFEGVSSGTDVACGVKKYQEVNRAKFREKWKHFLRNHPTPPRRYDFTTLHELSVRSWPRVSHEN